ncbi:AraC family transcriptional regulator [Saccharobesus litoralis]|uniref:AraC family transcriptional regulator n=1 Tax=Saccharobesus litoralis TaxID=2172099 RepID=A0A2S0VRI7_9ALTE|nr:AraC family transcriptional regulator [Saccharobesus litoralis]AWB66826.1 AraC family transcriptional regulator [Saccharobesus litoralis]
MHQYCDWPDLLEIGPECDERFVEYDKVPEMQPLRAKVSGISNLAGRYRVARSKPEWHGIVFTVAGVVELYTEQGHQSVEKCHLIALPAGKPFVMELEAKQLDIVWFHLDSCSHWDRLVNCLPSVSFCDMNQQIYHLLSLIYYEANAELRQPAVNQLHTYLNKTLDKPNKLALESQRIWQLVQDLEKRLHYPWTVQEMAKQINYSTPHLHRLFQNHFQRSPLQQLIFLRMERAKYLLQNSDWSIELIAEQVGYSDVFNFSKRFKKSLGIAPGQFRQRQFRQTKR